MLEHATDLKPTRLKSADEDIHDTEECMCFVELRVNGKAYVSPIAEQGSTPEWQWPFYFPVEGEPAGEGCDVAARFTVYNFLAKDQPQVRPICTCPPHGLWAQQMPCAARGARCRPDVLPHTCPCHELVRRAHIARAGQPAST